MISPTPKVLTEADTAGLPRAVSSEDFDHRLWHLILAWHNAADGSEKTIEYARLIDVRVQELIQAERDALAGRVAELEAALKPNLFWNDADPEHGETSIFEVIDSEWNCGWMKHGDEMVIQQAVRLPNIRVRLIPCPTDGDDYFDYEAIDAALSTTPESKP